MDAGAIILIASLAIIILLFSLLRRRGGPKKYPEVVQYLIWDIKLNQALAASFAAREKVKYFEENGWLLNKQKIGFLSESTKDMLKELFGLVEEYNKIIKDSRKNKDTAYRAINLTHFQELLGKCRNELEDWMLKNTGNKEYQQKSPSLTGFFLGDN
ncbi:MAG: hypothetical protein PHE50_05375 [Dehalococcoidales bacterium]|nr:hypothetical protein [Dehalococcoidales bacterium]